MLTSRHLGTLALSSSEDGTAYSATSMEIAGYVVRVTLTLRDATSFDQAAIDALDASLDALDDVHRLVLETMGAELAVPSSTTSEFWTFHREEVEALGNLSATEFVARLRLARLGLYPDGAYGAKGYLTLDYAIPEPQTDQLLVARFASDRSWLGFAWES